MSKTLKDAAKLAKDVASAAELAGAIGYFNGAQRGAASTEARGMLC
ncbi:MAG: hypothetical protein HOP09_06245 [Hyphomicrobium sp.]|nr:hypothetical protein [Hyphomicrobium sp.]